MGGQLIEGGVVLQGSVPRHVNPFGRTRHVDGSTIQGAVDDALAGDVIYIAPATYEENVVISTAGLTLVGLGARGQPWINPAAGGGMQIIADDTVLINLGVAGAAAAAYAMNVSAASECRFHGCKFEGPDDVNVLLGGDDDGQVGNCMFEDCEWAWCGAGVEFDNSGFGFPTQVRFRDCLFHNYTAAAVRNNAAGGGVADLWMQRCVFANQENGTEPTDYILVDRVGDTGIIEQCSFAAATITAAKMTIAAGILWVANMAEDGVSTARP